MPGFFRGARIGGLSVGPKPKFTGQSSYYQHGEYSCMKLLTSGMLTLDRIGPYDVFVVGGGGAGGKQVGALGAGGGGGYTATLRNFTPVNGREDISITIGYGAANWSMPRGGSSSFGSYISAEGGHTGQYSTGGYGGNGGSGGGSYSGFAGGANGSNGLGERPGTGQGTTTRAFEDQSEFLYSGGGGGSGNLGAVNPFRGGAGGEGGGGAGGTGNGATGVSGFGEAGAPNTGGGGGGSYCPVTAGSTQSPGGTGVVIIRWLSSYQPQYTGNASFYRHGVYDCMKLLTSGTLTLDRIGPFDIFAVGGGGAGADGGRWNSSSTGGSSTGGAGGGGGYCASIFNFIPVNGNENVTVTIGQGGVKADGGTTTFGSYLSANGGVAGTTGGSSTSKGGNGGSGGGSASRSYEHDAGNGGSDGSDGFAGSGSSASSIGIGQHSTTRAFDDATEALYAGGGGGSTNISVNEGTIRGGNPGTGGSGGGGNAGRRVAGTSGTPNTGGGGGAGSGRSSSGTILAGGDGGSGVVIIRWKAR